MMMNICFPVYIYSPNPCFTNRYVRFYEERGPKMWIIPVDKKTAAHLV